MIIIITVTQSNSQTQMRCARPNVMYPDIYDISQNLAPDVQLLV